jgi:hypothetical protein
LVFLLPGLVALLFILRGRVETAFLYVYLPCLLLFPNGYGYRLPHLPPLSAAESALLPIGIVALYRLISRRAFTLLDVLVFLFLVSRTLSEVFREPITNDGIFMSVDAFISIFLAYVTGRTLIEPNLRIASVRNIVIMILLLGPIGLIEWRLGMNPYGMINQKIFGGTLVDVPGTVQIRSGHGRMGASFIDAEIGGIAFGMTAALNAWLVYLNKRKPGVYLSGWLAKLEKRHIAGFLLLFYVWLTQSRGPLIAVAAAYLVLQIPKRKNVKLASAAVVIMMLLGALGAYAYFSRYTNVEDQAITNEQQGSAVYRKKMNEQYQPIAERGGWLGWGLLHHPSIGGLESIDNQFLLIHLAQGKLGWILFILISLESMRRVAINSLRFHTREDMAFAFSLLAALIVMWITLLTLYMGEQLPQFGFLLIGWGQSLVPGGFESSEAVQASAPPRFAFRRIYS